MQSERVKRAGMCLIIILVALALFGVGAYFMSGTVEMISEQVQFLAGAALFLAICYATWRTHQKNQEGGQDEEEE